MVCYGIKGHQSDVPSNVYDALYSVDNGKITFNDTINMGGNKISGLDIGIKDDDAVNKSQIDAVINRWNHFYFTTDLKHNNQKNVNFPTINRHPYESDTTEIIETSFEGYHHIIYTDYYKGNADTFRIHTNTTIKFSLNFDAKSDWTLLMINAVIKTNEHDYIQLSFRKGSTYLRGVGYSTFYIKYLHSSE